VPDTATSSLPMIWLLTSVNTASRGRAWWEVTVERAVVSPAPSAIILLVAPP